MKQLRYVVNDPIGIHARPAGLLIKATKELDSEITIEKVEGKSASAKKLMAVMGLGVKHGDTIVITVEGGNEDTALQVMTKFCEENL